VEVSQLGAMLSLQALALNNYLMMGAEPPVPRRDAPPNPIFNVYRARDGRWLALACFQFERYWAPTCRALGLQAYAELPAPDASPQGQARNAELAQLLASTFAAADRDHWLARLREHGVVCGPVQDYADVTRDPQVHANALIEELEHPRAGPIRQVGIPVKLSRTPGALRSTAPEHGQHTEEVLLEAGYSWDEIGALRARGAL
jgi:crotonobetainyl-CoA:carnitine CoA-transferase CaiB-like acyl-CoA transferase